MYGTGKKKIKASEILKKIALAFKIGAQGAQIAGTLSPQHAEKLNKYGAAFNKYGNAAEQTGSLVGQLGGGHGDFKSAMKSIGEFIAGKKKMKPEDLLITGGVLAAGVGAIMENPGLEKTGVKLITTGASGTAARSGFGPGFKQKGSGATDMRPIPGGPVAAQMQGQSGGAFDFGGLRKVGNWKKQIRTEYKQCKKRLRTTSGFRRKGARDKCRTEFKNKLKQFSSYTGLERPVNVTIGGYSGTTTSTGTANTVPISEGSKIAERLNPAAAGSAQSGGCYKCGRCPQRGKGMGGTGSKADVWAGRARRTSGGLMKADLMKNKKGKIVSKKMHARGKALYASLR